MLNTVATLRLSFTFQRVRHVPVCTTGPAPPTPLVNL
jgi:hypothetical protein